MKKANPDIHICAGLSDEQATEQFARMMGTTHPYDCVQHHAYVNTATTPIRSSLSSTAYYEQLLTDEPAQAGEVSDIQAAIDRYAGARASHIGVVVTEYGNLGGHPRTDPTFHESLSEAVLMGDDLVSWIDYGVPEADKANLNGFGAGSQPPGESTSIQQNQDSMIQRFPGGAYVLTPTGLVPELFRPLIGGTPVATTLTGNPDLAVGSGRHLPALDAVAVREPGGGLDVVVVNQDPDRALTARVDATGSYGAVARTATLDGPSITSTNDATTQPVHVTDSTTRVGTEAVDYSFPAHSITRIEFTGAG